MPDPRRLVRRAESPDLVGAFAFWAAHCARAAQSAWRRRVRATAAIARERFRLRVRRSTMRDVLLGSGA
ncbi:MAG TPA: hypothetical protein VIG68_05125, partial [Lysobacter sp.]